MAMDQNGVLKKIRYSCCQEHNSRNPNWKPFQYLEQYCRKWGYGDIEIGMLLRKDRPAAEL